MPAWLCSPVSLAMGAHASSLDARHLLFPSPGTVLCASEPYLFPVRHLRSSRALPSGNGGNGPTYGRLFIVCMAAQRRSLQNTNNRQEKGVEQPSASIPNDSSSEAPSSRKSFETTTSIEVPSISSPTSTYFGSPLLWIGVGVGLSAFFSWAANGFKRYAMQQVFKSLLGGSASSMSQFGGFPMSPGSPFPFPPTSPETPTQVLNSPSAAAPASNTIDVSATDLSVDSETTKKVEGSNIQTKKPAFTDVDPKILFEQNQNLSSSSSAVAKVSIEEAEAPKVPSEQDQVAKQGTSSNRSGDKEATFNASKGKSMTSLFTIEMLEKMMDDPTIQNMVYPYLPEEMRNPAAYKWMMQNPQYRLQLQEMLNSMSDGGVWDSQMPDLLKNVDLNTKDVKQQFEQLGVTPEEAIAKVMANPDIAMAFQNPKVQAAIMDCSTNPLNITKYQNDKEVMDVFNQISELFPETNTSAFNV